MTPTVSQFLPYTLSLSVSCDLIILHLPTSCYYQVLCLSLSHDPITDTPTSNLIPKQPLFVFVEPLTLKLCPNFFNRGVAKRLIVICCGMAITE